MSVERWVTEIGLRAVAAFEITTFDVILRSTLAFATAVFILTVIVVTVVITAISLLTLSSSGQVRDLALVFAHSNHLSSIT